MISDGDIDFLQNQHKHNPSETYFELRYPEISQTTSYTTNSSEIYGEGVEANRHETIRAVLPCFNHEGFIHWNLEERHPNAAEIYENRIKTSMN